MISTMKKGPWRRTSSYQISSASITPSPSPPPPPSSSPRPRALINGFGRIGRLALRRALGATGNAAGSRAAEAECPFDVVAVNDPNAVAETAAYLLQWDSVQGVFGEGEVNADGTGFTFRAPGRDAVDIAFTKAARLEDVREKER